MASSPADAATPSARAFALQELIACWDQGYEALVRGEVDRAQALLDVAEDHVATAGDGHGDNAHEAALRTSAASSRGRLEHAIRAGLDGVQQELGRTRRGGRALRGYGSTTPDATVVRDV
jgi:hypothetical protein